MNQGYEKFFKQAKQVRQPSGNLTGASGEPQFKISKTSEKKNSPSKGRQFLSEIDQHFETSATGHHLTPEQKLKIKFIERKRQLGKQMARGSKVPYFAILCLTAIIVFVTLGFLNFQKVNSILRRIDIQMNGAMASDKPGPSEAKKNASPAQAVATSGAAAATTANPADPAAVKAEKKSQTEAAKAKSEIPDLRNMTKEELSYFSHLVDRKKELDQREGEQNKLDEELQKQRAELDQKIQKLEKMRAEISGILKDRVAVDQEKVEKLVQFYSTMKAQQAARVIESLNEELAVEVLDRMKKKSAAEIMNSLDPKKAKKLSEMLAGYRKPASEDEPKR